VNIKTKVIAMKLKEFKFTDQRVQVDIALDLKLQKKIRFCLDYLVNRLPVNQLADDDSFDFDTLEFDEGKNYNWYFLNKENLTMLIRQYGNHFTFYVKCKEEYQTNLSVFTMGVNDDKMTDDESDEFCDDNFATLRKILPALVKMIEKGKVHAIWNNISLEQPKHTEFKLAMYGSDSVDSLDVLLFAADEIFSTYMCTYAENEALEQIKGLKVGDKFGRSYIITEVRTDHEEGDDYHGCGLKYTNNNFPDKKPEWSDVYSLVSFHYDDLEYDDRQREEKVMKFIHKNHNKVIIKLASGKQELFMWMVVVSKYIEIMYELYEETFISELDLKTFHKCINEEFRTFIKTSYNITQS
jgi:hypothetical protein